MLAKDEHGSFRDQEEINLLSNEAAVIQSTGLWVRMILRGLQSTVYKAPELFIERFFTDSLKHPSMTSRRKNLRGQTPYLGCVSEQRIKSLFLIMRESRVPQ